MKGNKKGYVIISYVATNGETIKEKSSTGKKLIKGSIEDKFIALLQEKKGKCIKRKALAKAFLMSDTQMRETLRNCRNYIVICNNQDGKGYYIPQTRKEISRWIAQENSRANNIYKGIKVAKWYMTKLPQ